MFAESGFNVGGIIILAEPMAAESSFRFLVFGLGLGFTVSLPRLTGTKYE